jgi:hypothetical protein
MSYEMRGQFLEVCDCSLPCPCWFDQEPDEAECTGLVAWQIEQGKIGTVSVSNLAVVNVSFHVGKRGKRGEHPQTRGVLFVDQTASTKQVNALGKAFTGELGGPLGELAEMNAKVQGPERIAISFESDGGSTRVTVGTAASAEMTPLVGSTERITTVADSALATLLGSPGEVGSAQRFELDIPKLKLDVQDRSATRGRFAYVLD